MICQFCDGPMDIVQLNPDAREAYHCPACKTIVEIQHRLFIDDRPDLAAEFRRHERELVYEEYRRAAREPGAASEEA